MSSNSPQEAAASAKTPKKFEGGQKTSQTHDVKVSVHRKTPASEETNEPYYESIKTEKNISTASGAGAGQKNNAQKKMTTPDVKGPVNRKSHASTDKTQPRPYYEDHKFAKNLPSSSGASVSPTEASNATSMKIPKAKATSKRNLMAILGFLTVATIVMSFAFIVERKIESERDAVELTNKMMNVNETIESLGMKIGELEVRMAESFSAIVGLDVDLKKMEESTNAIKDMSSYLLAAYSVPGSAYGNLCEVKYSGDCFSFAIHPTADVNLTQAEEICRERRSKPSVVFDSAHYNMLLQYLQTHVPNGSEFVCVWTGLVINTETKHVTFDGGKPAPYTRWHPGHPLDDPDRTAISLHARPDSDASAQGMGNNSPSGNCFGVVCMLRAPQTWSSDFPPFVMAELGWFLASNGYWYKLYTTGVNYENAKQECASVGAVLVSKGMRDETVRSEITSSLIKPRTNNVWIGLDDLALQNDYVWLDGVRSTNAAINWYTGEPNDANERCCHIRRGMDWKINDERCDKEYAYLCEMAL